MTFYHDDSRRLQALFGSTALADRLEERVRRDHFTDADKAFVEGVSFFFLATADRDGRPDCSFKGGAPGFVRVVAPDLLEFPDYDGNGMFRSLGNIVANANVGLLFIAMDASPKRLRVNGRATLVLDAAQTRGHAGSQALIQVTPQHIFPNCPRYIPDLPNAAPSKFLPIAGSPPVEPGWKTSDDFKDVVPPRKA
jgi:uncharacterized protein